ncbi:hypothetical protein L1887_34743 [Cichorium endivia]|nr:hypothetical protein L1887_34743 [Cichorium endivia]
MNSLHYVDYLIQSYVESVADTYENIMNYFANAQRKPSVNVAKEEYDFMIHFNDDTINKEKSNDYPFRLASLMANEFSKPDDDILKECSSNPTCPLGTTPYVVGNLSVEKPVDGGSDMLPQLQNR